jgi:hypothetical protein
LKPMADFAHPLKASALHSRNEERKTCGIAARLMYPLTYRMPRRLCRILCGEI